MKAPEKIYVKEFDEGISQMWSGIKTTETSANAQHEYIRKDALLEWATTNRDKLDVLSDNDAVHWGQRNAFQQMIDKLNQM